MKGGCLKDASGSNSHEAYSEDLPLSFKTQGTSVYYLANLCMLALALL